MLKWFTGMMPATPKGPWMEDELMETLLESLLQIIIKGPIDIETGLDHHLIGEDEEVSLGGRVLEAKI